VPWTYLVTPSLDRIIRGFPGYAIAEVPRERLFITTGMIGGNQPVCYYVSSTDGRVVREILLEFPRSGRNVRSGSPLWQSRGPNVRPIFVPGHELLLVPNLDSTGSASQLVYTEFRCGPVGSSTVESPPSAAPVNEPPAAVAAGEEFRFTPVLQPGTLASNFRLKRGAPGMTIDAATGELRWRPGNQHLGRWAITIVAEVAGEVATVIAWTLEVR
jgi:hypothetical protein